MFHRFGLPTIQKTTQRVYEWNRKVAANLINKYRFNKDFKKLTRVSTAWRRDVSMTLIINIIKTDLLSKNRLVTTGRRCKNIYWHLAILVGCLLCAIPSSVQAQVSMDTPTHGQCGTLAGSACVTDTVLTFAHTTNSSSNRAMAITLMTTCSAGTMAASPTVTYNLVSLGAATETVTPVADRRRGELFALPAGTQPATGTNNVIITFAGAICGAGNNYQVSAGVFTASGVDQTTSFTDTNINSGTGASATLTLTGSGANDAGFHAMCSGDTIVSTTETQQWLVNNTNFGCGSSGGATAAAADTSFSWTITSDSWIITGGAFKAASGTGPSVDKVGSMLIMFQIFGLIALLIIAILNAEKPLSKNATDVMVNAKRSEVVLVERSISKESL